MKKLNGVVVLVCWLVMLGMVGRALGEEKPEVFAQLGHSSTVYSVAFSLGGRFALSGGADKNLKLWDVASGREIRTFTGHSDSVNSVAFSPDGKFALSGSSDNTIKLWNLDSGREIKTFKGHSKAVQSVAFSPNGKLIMSGSHDNTSKLWDVASGNEIRTFTEHSSSVLSVVFSPDGKCALSGEWGENTLNLWDLDSGKRIRTFTGHKGMVHSVAFSPNGRFALSGSSDDTMKLWDVATGQEIRTFKGHSSGVNSVVFSPDGEFALSGSSDKTLKLWQVVSGKTIKTLTDDSESIHSVTFSPDGKFALTGGWHSPLKLWEVASGNIIKTFKGYSESIRSAKYSLDGKFVLTGSSDNSLKIWEMASGSKIRTFAGHVKSVESVAFSPDGKFALSGSADKTLKLWDVASGKEVRTYSGHSDDVYSVAFSPDGKFALSGSWDKTSKLWDVAIGKEIWTFSGHTSGVTSVAFSPNGEYALTGSSDKTLKLWNVAREWKISSLWDMANKWEIRTFTGHSSGIHSIAFSPDGRFGLSGSYDKTMKLWDVASGREIRSFDEYEDLVSSVAFSPDGRFALSGSRDKTLKLWDVASGKAIQVFTGYPNLVNTVAFSPDGNIGLSGSQEGTVCFWSIATGKEIAQFISFTDGEWISITPEGYYNASPNGDKHLNVRIGNNVYGIENYREAFFRPDLVKLALAGKLLEGMQTLADVKQAPGLSIINTPENITTDEVKVTLKLTDQGGGIGDVRLFLNGSAVSLDNGRRISNQPASAKAAVTRSYTLKLSKGENSISAIAFNKDNSMQSNAATQRITANFTSTRKSSLHALVIGVNEFKNPKLKLQYAAPDAKLFAETIAKGASSLFESVKITTLTTPAETTRESILAALKKYQKLDPDDVFIFYVASHGTVDDGEYFMITSNVGSTRTEKLKTDALTQRDLKEQIANIPATKKMIIIDTCNAGALGETLQVAMMARGMSEDTAMKILSRSVGSTILSASSSVQEALEGYKGHGLFTWVLVQGLKGGADKGKSGFVKTTELADYVDSEVPALAELVFKKAQYPTVNTSGNGFPIGKVGR